MDDPVCLTHTAVLLDLGSRHFTMSHILPAVSSSIDYANIDIETVFVLFLILSLVVGLLVNFPVILFIYV